MTPVTTMGGLKVIPDIKLEECSFENADTLILPGEDTWSETIHRPIIRVVEKCLEEGVLVAAICGSTIRLAQTGLLNLRPYTSNDLEHLKMICPTYTGEKYYRTEPVVTDGNLITASGIAPLEFSVHILGALDAFPSEALDAWYSLCKTMNQSISMN